LNDYYSVSCGAKKKLPAYELGDQGSGVLSTAGVLSSVIKQEGVEPIAAFNAEVKNAWSHVSTVFTFS